MNRILLIIYSALITFHSFGQDSIKILEDFQIEDHNYIFCIDPLETENSSFYISDKSKLSELQQSWIADKGITDGMLYCSYDYKINIIENDSIVGSIDINSWCGQAIVHLYADGKSTIYDFTPYDPFKDLVSDGTVYDSTFKVRDGVKAVNFRNALFKTDSVFSPFFLERNEKLKYAGDFNFNVTTTDSSKRINSDRIENLLEEYYKDFDFDLNLFDRSNNQLTYRISSDSSFYTFFKNHLVENEDYIISVPKENTWLPMEIRYPKLQMSAYLFSLSEEKLRVVLNTLK